MAVDSYKGLATVETVETLHTTPGGRPLNGIIHLGRTEAANAVDDTLEPIHSFAECRDFLKEYGIDLEQTGKERIKKALRWGEIFHEEVDKFEAALNQLEISAADLGEIEGHLKTHPEQKPKILIGIDHKRPEQLYQRLVIDPIKADKLLLKALSNYQRIDPATGESLSDQTPSGKAGIAFLLESKPALEKISKGKKYLGPQGWLIHFYESLDEGLHVLYPDLDLDTLSAHKYKKILQEVLKNRAMREHLLDAKTITRFPHLRNKEDFNLALYTLYSNNDCQIRSYSCKPKSSKNSSLKSRPIFGNFTA
jgi:hypothetical protein